MTIIRTGLANVIDGMGWLEAVAVEFVFANDNRGSEYQFFCVVK